MILDGIGIAQLAVQMVKSGLGRLMTLTNKQIEIVMYLRPQ